MPQSVAAARCFRASGARSPVATDLFFSSCLHMQAVDGRSPSMLRLGGGSGCQILRHQQSLVPRVKLGGEAGLGTSFSGGLVFRRQALGVFV
jgi:hypothetical protein